MEEIVYQSNFELENSYWWFTAREKIIGAMIERYCTDLKPGDAVVDVGCGTGGFLSSLAGKYKAIGIDVSETAIAYCRRRGLEHLYLTTLEDFKPVDTQVKAVVMLDVIEHIDDDRSVVQQAYKLLAPGGYMVATVPAYQWLWSTHDEIHMHKRRYTRSQFGHLLANAGFRPVKSTYFNTLLFPVAALKRLTEKDKKYTSSADVVDRVSPGMNSLLHKVFSMEVSLLPYASFPFGLSILIIAQKPQR